MDTGREGFQFTCWLHIIRFYYAPDSTHTHDMYVSVCDNGMGLLLILSAHQKELFSHHI